MAIVRASSYLTYLYRRSKGRNKQPGVQNAQLECIAIIDSPDGFTRRT